MMKIVPIKNTVLCRKNEKKDETESKILFKKTTVDEYSILDFSSDEEFPFSIGDTVIVSSPGDEIECENETLYLFKTSNVVAKISDI